MRTLQSGIHLLRTYTVNILSFTSQYNLVKNSQDRGPIGGVVQYCIVFALIQLAPLILIMRHSTLIILIRELFICQLAIRSICKMIISSSDEIINYDDDIFISLKLASDTDQHSITAESMTSVHENSIISQADAASCEPLSSKLK